MLTDIIPFFLLLVINIVIIFRRIGKFEIQTWIAFSTASLIIILIDPSNGFNNAINALTKQAETFVFLFTMMILVNALELSELIDFFVEKLLNYSKSGFDLLIIIHFAIGLSASILLNDTIAILGPIIIIYFTRSQNMDEKPFVLAVAFGLTYGSALLPIGNPQNYILATNGNINFVQFFAMALIPTIISMTISIFILKLIYKKSFNRYKFVAKRSIYQKTLSYKRLQQLTILAFLILICGLIVSSLIHIPMVIIFLTVVNLFLLFAKEREEILNKIDWSILILFAGMFVVIDAVVKSELFILFNKNFFGTLQDDFTSLVLFIIFIFILCQFLSNVPVAIIIASVLPFSNINLPHFWIVAALTTTFAGASTVLGAASNIIVIETSKRKGLVITWFDIAKIGIPSSLLSLIGLIVMGWLYYNF